MVRSIHQSTMRRQLTCMLRFVLMSGRLYFVVCLVCGLLLLWSMCRLPRTVDGVDYDTVALASSVIYQFDFDHNKSRIASSDGEIQPVGKNGSESYVYSAYIDDRPAPDVDSQTLPVVRVLTWFRRAEQQHVVRHWRCLLWFDQLNSSLEVPVGSWTDLDEFHKTSRIITAIVNCRHRTPSDVVGPTSSSGDVVARAVSLVTSRYERSPRNKVELVDLRQQRRQQNTIADRQLSSDHGATHSRTEGGREGTRTFQLHSATFTVCIHSPLFGTEYTASDLLEFVEVNRMFGVERFLLYVEPSVDRQPLTCLERYERLGVVELRRWSLPADIADDVHYHGQILAMNDCLYRTMYVTKYLALHDLDEFIVPQQTTNWNDMLENVNRRFSERDADSKIAAYMFRHKQFTARLSDDPLSRRRGLRTLLRLTAYRKLHPWKIRTKVLVRPERLITVHVHEVLASNLVDVLGGGGGWLWWKNRFSVVRVDEIDAVLFHYRHNNETTDLQVVTRMRDFESDILARFDSASRQFETDIEQ